jgi:hypothetical protein
MTPTFLSGFRHFRTIIDGDVKIMYAAGENKFFGLSSFSAG